MKNIIRTQSRHSSKSWGTNRFKSSWKDKFLSALVRPSDIHMIFEPQDDRVAMSSVYCWSEGWSKAFYNIEFCSVSWSKGYGTSLSMATIFSANWSKDEDFSFIQDRHTPVSKSWNRR